MRKNYKVLISIGFILLIAVTSGVIFQVNKTDQSLAYTKQQEETKIATDYASAINSIKDGKFPEIKKSFENLKGYKDADTILQYMGFEVQWNGKPG